MSDFKNKKILITGATSGIGRAIATYFAKEKADVILVGRNEERGMLIQESLKEHSPNCIFVRCDITKEEEVFELKSFLSKNNYSIDILINNAGVFITQDLEHLEYKNWQKSFETNVDGAMFMTKAFIGDLRKNKGCIVNNASVSGLDIFTSGTKNYMYGASKAALVKFSKLCALNYAPDVRVNVICPGIVDTEIFENRDFSRFDGVIPIGYIAKPEQIAKVVKFLASDDADYITGAVIPVDGGMSLK